MINLRRSGERGHTKLNWLDSRHTFSFGDYHDQQYMGFRDLRVINEDRVEPGAGFPTHSHRDMEIITYVLEGAGFGLIGTLGMASGSSRVALRCCIFLYLTISSRRRL